MWYNVWPMQFKTRWTLCSVMGIPVRLDFSVALLGVYFLYTFYNSNDVVTSILFGLYAVAVLLVSILLHELAHSVTAIAFGGYVRDITLQLLGGCATIARMPSRPWQEFAMAFAGPLCSFILAGLAYIGAIAFGETIEGYLPNGQYVHFFEYNVWFFVAVIMNVGLGCFNLIPAFPMDGGRLLRSGCQMYGKDKVRATEIAVVVGRCFAGLWILITLLDWFFGMSIPAPKHLPEWAAFLWDIVLGSGGELRLLIAFMIWTVGKRELDYVRAEAQYAGGWR